MQKLIILNWIRKKWTMENDIFQMLKKCVYPWHTWSENISKQRAESLKIPFKKLLAIALIIYDNLYTRISQWIEYTVSERDCLGASYANK